MSRGGRWERIAVRLNAILRKVPKQQSLDGKAWRAETSARRSLMRYIVGIVGRLIEEEAERAYQAERQPNLRGQLEILDTRPGDTIDIRVSGGADVPPHLLD